MHRTTHYAVAAGVSVLFLYSGWLIWHRDNTTGEDAAPRSVSVTDNHWLELYSTPGKRVDYKIYADKHVVISDPLGDSVVPIKTTVWGPKRVEGVLLSDGRALVIDETESGLLVGRLCEPR